MDAGRNPEPFAAVLLAELGGEEVLGPRRFLRMVELADTVLERFRPRVMKRLGTIREVCQRTAAG